MQKSRTFGPAVSVQAPTASARISAKPAPRSAAISQAPARAPAPPATGGKRLVVLLAVCDYGGILWNLRCAINRHSSKYHAVQVSTQTNPFQYPIEIICESGQKNYVQSLVDEADCVIATDYDLPEYGQAIKIKNFKKCIYYGTGRNYRYIQKNKIFDKWKYRLVSTPDLLCRPDDVYIPAPLDTDRLCPKKQRTVESLKRQTVLMHTPSARANKGTDDILAAINKIVATHKNIKYSLIEHMPNHKVLALKSNADIFLDQFGKYKFLGYNSLEAAAYESAVVLDTSQESSTPAIHATVNTLPRVISGLMSDPARIIENGKRMRSWCAQHHGYKSVYDKLAAYLDNASA